MHKLMWSLLFLLGLITFSSSTNVQAAEDSNDYGIKIDGNFDDWKNVKKTDIVADGDGFNIKRGALLADANNIYFYLEMSPEHGTGYSNLQTDHYDLRVGNKRYWLQIEDKHYLNIGQMQNITIHCWEDDKSGGSINENLPHAQAIVKRVPVSTDSGVVDGSSDITEWKIPLTDLGVKGTTSQNISIQNTNLGKQTLTTTGGSTGPILLAASGLVIAIFGLTRVPKINELRKSLHE